MAPINSKNDIIIGGSGSQTEFGGDGDDQMFGRGRSFNIETGVGTIELAGDFLFGEGDNDDIFGDARKVTLDAKRSIFAGSDGLDGGFGKDDLFGDVEIISVKRGAFFFGDDLMGGGAGSGDDRMWGDARSADLRSGDTLKIAPSEIGASPVVEAGDDTMSGGSGNDEMYGDFETIDVSIGFGFPDKPAPIDRAEAFGPGGTGSVAFGDDRMFGNRNADVMIGDAKRFSFSDGKDFVIDDRLLTNDVIGKPGLEMDMAGDDFMSGGSGGDTIIGDFESISLNTGPSPAPWGFFGDDTINGGSGDDLLIGDAKFFSGGSHGGDRIETNGVGGERAGDDVISGGSGDDTIAGDFLNGGPGDIVPRGPGGPVSGGDDTMTGGRGADLFVFGKDFGTDLILDFSTGSRVFRGGEDMLDLSAFGIDGGNFSKSDAFGFDASGNVEFEFFDGSVLTLLGVRKGDLGPENFKKPFLDVV